MGCWGTAVGDVASECCREGSEELAAASGCVALDRWGEGGEISASEPRTGESWGTSISSKTTALPRGMAEGLLVGRGISTVDGTDKAAVSSGWEDAAC